jgi:hypothetical protein
MRKRRIRRSADAYLLLVGVIINPSDSSEFFEIRAVIRPRGGEELIRVLRSRICQVKEMLSSIAFISSLT